MPRFGKSTGERVDPVKRKRVVGLIAQGKSANQISKDLHISRHTVAAIVEADAVPIAQRKQELMCQAARIAGMAADQVEAQIATAPLNQAAVVFGIMADKVTTLSSDPQRIEVSVTGNISHGHSLVERMETLAKTIEAKVLSSKTGKGLDSERSPVSDTVSKATVGTPNSSLLLTDQAPLSAAVAAGLSAGLGIASEGEEPVKG